MSESPDIYRRVRLQFDENMIPKSPSSLSPIDCKIRALAIWPSRTVVPVIFIPGIMGSNLRNKKQDASAWQPPNGIGESIKELRKRLRQAPEARQEQLTAEDCEVFDVDNGVKLPDKYLALDEEEAKRRHWGEVHADSYLKIIQKLEELLNHPFKGIEYGKPELDEAWRYAITPKKKKWTPKNPLTEAEFKARMGKIYFPVHACGYNWLESNEKSAQRVVQRVAEIEERLKKGSGYYTYSGKVILITHSMGGLVGRRAAQLLGEKVLGVFHGVQPVTGAPAVYRRFKGGTETNGFFDVAGAGAAVVLGWDAADVTCVLGNSAGPMELLPTADYEKGWLHITDGEKTIRLPKEDPYKEIYEISAQDKWWGMVDPDLLDPAGIYKEKKLNPYLDGFGKQLKTAKGFHDTIKLSAHTNTYAHYGDDPSQRSLARVVWRTCQNIADLSDKDILEGKRTHTKLTGRTDLEISDRRISFDMDGKHDPGDGTVPTPSGDGCHKAQ